MKTRILLQYCQLPDKYNRDISRHITFTGPCIVNIFPKYNQQDVTLLHLFISVKCSTSFRRVFRPSSGAQNCTYSARYLSDQYLTLYVQFWAPDNGQKNRLKHVHHFTEINKLSNVTSCWLYFGNISRNVWNFSRYFEIFIYDFKISCRTLAGKHWLCG